MPLRISLAVVRCPQIGRAGRVRYQYGPHALIPEELVLRRWRDRSGEPAATRSGVRFDGCRLPPGTWTLLRDWLADGLSMTDVTTETVLAERAAANRRSGSRLRAPVPTKFARMNQFLQQKGVLGDVVERSRNPDRPGLPDLFLYRVDRHGRVHGGRFVEVKRWDRKNRIVERVSPEQKEELAFLRELGLPAQVVYLLE